MFDRWLGGDDVDNAIALLDKLSVSDDDTRPLTSGRKLSEYALQACKTQNSGITTYSDDVWKWHTDQRRQEYRQWFKAIGQSSIIDEIVELSSKLYHRNQRQKFLSHQHDAKSIRILEKVAFLCTNSYFAINYGLMRALKLTVIRLDEAALIPSAYTLLMYALPDLRQMISVGDFQQMNPQYRETMFEGAPFDLNKLRFGLGHETDGPKVMLNVQGRMTPNLSYIHQQLGLYDPITSADHTKQFKLVAGIKTDYLWIHTNSPETSYSGGQFGTFLHATPGAASSVPDAGKAICNRGEAKICFDLARWLLRNGDAEPGQIAIITPYCG